MARTHWHFYISVKSSIRCLSQVRGESCDIRPNIRHDILCWFLLYQVEAVLVSRLFILQNSSSSALVRGTWILQERLFQRTSNSIFISEIEFTDNCSINFSWQVDNKYEIRTAKFNFLKIL